MRYLWISAPLLAALLAPEGSAQEGEKKGPALNVGGLDQPGAAVTGIVKWKGEKPARKPIAEIAGNAFCKECHKDGLPLHERWVFGKNGADDTLQHVLVYVSKGLEGKKFDPPKQPVILDQIGCLYTPHVVGIMAGQTLEIRNSDGTLHNVMCNPRNNRAFNQGMSVKNEKLEKVFANPELRVDLRCFMHPWMLAWVHVLEHPFFAVTQTDGTFTIKGLPPGEYEISVLHEASRFAAEPATVAVKLAAGETKKLEFTFQDKAEK